MVSHYKFISLSMIFCISISCACTQSKTLKKAYAFSMQINAGAPPKYKNGVEVSRSQKKEFIYIECTGNIKPIINEVNYKGILYSNPEIFFAGHEQVKAGVNKSNGKPITLTPAKGNSFWRIEITVSYDEDNNKVSTQNMLIIKGEKEGHPFSVKIDNEVFLKPFIGS